MSVPKAPNAMPAASAAPAPVLEPPGVRSGSHGLRAGGKWSASVAAASPNSCVASLPRITAPAARARRTSAASSWAMLVASNREPAVVGPRLYRSLKAIGTPCSGPRQRPPAISDSAICA